MRSIRFSLLGLVCALVLAFPASADCKTCSGAYCPSVNDLALGHDHCDMSTSQVTKLCSPPGATLCIEWTTNCVPAGPECTNDHTSITVSGGSGGSGYDGSFGSIENMNQLLCWLGYGSYWDC